MDSERSIVGSTKASACTSITVKWILGSNEELVVNSPACRKLKKLRQQAAQRMTGLGSSGPMIWETNCAGANSENKQTGTEMLGVPTELEQNETAEHGSPRCSSRGTGTMLLALCTQEAVGSSVPSVLLPPPRAGRGSGSK